MDQLTGGRLTLGRGIGWRATDFQLTGRDFGDRGRRFDTQLRDLAKACAGEPSPGARGRGARARAAARRAVDHRGTADASVRRVVEFGKSTAVPWRR